MKKKWFTSILFCTIEIEWKISICLYRNSICYMFVIFKSIRIWINMTLMFYFLWNKINTKNNLIIIKNRWISIFVFKLIPSINDLLWTIRSKLSWGWGWGYKRVWVSLSWRNTFMFNDFKKILINCLNNKEMFSAF